MMDVAPGSFSRADFELQLQRQVFLLTEDCRLHPDGSPRAFLLGGQSGAGKSILHGVLVEELAGNAIVVNGDEYRSSHPRFNEIVRDYGVDAVRYTAPWAGKMTEALIEALSAAGYNLIIEGTLRTVEVPLQTARVLKARGYKTSLAVMAAKPDISAISCLLRYEKMRGMGMVPRMVDPSHNDEIVAHIVPNLALLEDSGLFDEVRVYSRRRLLASITGGAREACAEGGQAGEKESRNFRRASDVLEEVLRGPWSAEETAHYRFLRAKLKSLQDG